MSRVLLLEAGGRDIDPLIRIPLGIGKMHEHRLHDWGYETEPEPQSRRPRASRRMRGKVLGGSSSINVMAYTRGNPRRLRPLGAQRRDAAGPTPTCCPISGAARRWERGADQFRGGDGPARRPIRARRRIRSSTPGSRPARRRAFRVTPDYNGAQQEGFGRGQFTIRNGRRSSSARAYLRPVRGRRNLTVETGAHATRVTDRGQAGDRRRISSRAARLDGPRGARGDPVGGAFNTPQLLMLSGIGPADHLRQIGIAPLVDLPGVGKNLQDHLGIWITWTRAHRRAVSMREMRFDRMALEHAARLFPRHRTRNHGARRPARFRQDAAGCRGARHRVHVPHRAAATRICGFRASSRPIRTPSAIRPTLLHPESRGEILLRSADPARRAAHRLQFLLVAERHAAARRAASSARARSANSRPSRPIAASRPRRGPRVDSDAEIDAFIRRTTITAHHPCGTCTMGDGARRASLDPALRLRGVDGLRVVDASAMPDIVSAHINACVLMIGEKAADLIRADA